MSFDNKKIIKMLGLNFGIALADIVIFSPGLIGIKLMGGSIFASAFGAAVIFLSLGSFVYGNYKILTGSQKVIQTSLIKTKDDYIAALRQHKHKEAFEPAIDVVITQIERFEKKKETIFDILIQRFNIEELSYKKFQAIVLEVENIFFVVIKSILNRLNAFDENDYSNIKNQHSKMDFSKEFINDKIQVYNEYISFVKNAAEDNEQIILKLDKLLFEISKLESIEDGEIENMEGIKEIDELIKQTKFYK